MTTLEKTLSGILLILIIGLIVLYVMYDSKDNQLISANAVLSEKEATIREFRTADGKTVTEKPAAEISRDDLKHYPDIVKDMKSMQVEIKRLNSIITAGFNATGKGEVIIVRDTITQNSPVSDSVQVNDGYLQLKGGINSNRFGYSYQYQDSLTFALSWKKKWLFGKETLYGTGSLSNPNAKILNQTAIKIQGARDKRFVISAGVSYDPFQNQFSPSIHAGYAIFKF